VDDAQTVPSKQEISKQDLPNQGSDARTAVDPRWKRRLYMIMSFFVCWQTLAIIVPPMPQGSRLVQSLRSVLQPYITIFRLDNSWSFFAPGVGRGGEFRYVVEGSDGRRHVFHPTEEKGSVPEFYMWREWKYFYDKVMLSADRGGILLRGFTARNMQTSIPCRYRFCGSRSANSRRTTICKVTGTTTQGLSRSKHWEIMTVEA